MNDYDIGGSVQQSLDRAYWPWPLALAYSIGSNRQTAIKDCVAVLDGSAGVPAEYVGRTALHMAYAHAIGEPDTPEIDWEQMQSIERPLVAAIESDKIAWRGRSAPGQPLGNPCDSAQWVGADIHAEATADLVTKGYRQFHGHLDTVLGNRARTVWLYDIHLKAADVKRVVDGETRMLDFIKHSSGEERILFSEMFETALRGRPSSDVSVYMGPNGEMEIVPHPSIDNMEKEFARTVQGFRDVTKGLSSGVLTCLVEEKYAGQLYKIPRFYWFFARSNLSHIENRDNVPPQFVGQPVQVELRHLESWKGVLSPPPSLTAPRRTDRQSAPLTKPPTMRHRHLFRFFSIMTNDIRDGTRLNAHANYVRWLKRDRSFEKPFARNTFERMLEHHKDGWKIDENHEWALE